MRFIPTRLHAVADYGTAALLVALPWLLGLAAADGGAGEGRGALIGVSVTAGLAVALLSLLTNYEGGLFPAFTMPVHLAAGRGPGGVPDRRPPGCSGSPRRSATGRGPCSRRSG